jgi:hypothetical protein
MDFFTISAEDITAMVGYTKDFISDFMPILVIVLGLAIAFWVVKVLFKLKD